MSAIDLLPPPSSQQAGLAQSRKNDAATDLSLRGFREALERAQPRASSLDRTPTKSAPPERDTASNTSTATNETAADTAVVDEEAGQTDTDPLDATTEAEEVVSSTDDSQPVAIEGQSNNPVAVGSVFEADLRVDFKLTIETAEGDAIASGAFFLDDAFPGQAQVTPLSISGPLGEIDPTLLQGLPVEVVQQLTLAAATPQATQTLTTTTTQVLPATDPAQVAAPLAEAQPILEGDGQPTGEGDADSLLSQNPALQSAMNAMTQAGGEASTFTLPESDPNPLLAVQPSVDASSTKATPTNLTSLLASDTSATGQAGTDEALNTARLQRGLNSALNQQGGNVTLRLTPPEMGTVKIQLQLQGGSVSAQFHAETESARSLLTQQLGSLRSALESQGLTVDRLGVQSLTSNTSSNLQQQANSDQQPSQQQSSQNDGRSRGGFQQPPQQQQSQQQSPLSGGDGTAEGLRDTRGFRSFFGE